MSYLIPDYNNFNQRAIVHSIDECSRCIIGIGGDGTYHSGNQPKVLVEKGQNMKKYAIRKLTPIECFRLQGMCDSDVEKARALGISDSQLYKIAGNGLTTNCVQFIMEHVYKAIVNPNFETTDEKMVRLGYGA